jgi:hypothetical protein
MVLKEGEQQLVCRRGRRSRGRHPSQPLLVPIVAMQRHPSPGGLWPDAVPEPIARLDPEDVVEFALPQESTVECRVSSAPGATAVRSAGKIGGPLRQLDLGDQRSTSNVMTLDRSRKYAGLFNTISCSTGVDG